MNFDRFQIVPVLRFKSWVLNENWIIDLSSALVGMLLSSSKLFLFFKQSSFKLRCETVLCQCYEHWNPHLPVYLKFELLHFCFWMWVVVSDLNKKIGGSTDLAKEKAQIRGFAYPSRCPSQHPNICNT